MCAEPAKRDRPLDVNRLLRPQNRLDIILDLDELTGRADVRSSMILDITGEQVVVAQTDPPIMKSAIGREVEATMVHHDLITYESSRWGWSAHILGLNNEYRLNPGDLDSIQAAVVFLSLPPKTGIRKTNIRQPYRMEIVGPVERANLRLDPEPAPVSLINFSAGGLMLATSVPPAFSLGQELKFYLTFAGDADNDEVSISGQAAVVRLEYDPGDRQARMGVKFQALDAANDRALQRIIQRFMLEEQRRRNRDR